MAANHTAFWDVVSLLAFAMSISVVAEASFHLTRRSIHPPFGNSLFLQLNATGVQIYRCDNSSNGHGMMEYNHIGATAKLYSPYGNHEQYISVGYHYYLSHPLAQGGQPTFSFSKVEGDPVSAIPESTVTVNGIATKKANNKDDIDDVLLKVVSHSGYGKASEVSYVQRRHSKGGVPPSSCEEDANEIQVPYTSQYLFWSQDKSLIPAGILNDISIDSENFSPLFGFYSEGHQHYKFNGSSWINFNATAFLYTSPGKEEMGRHYFLAETDENGGQPSWDLFMPAALSKVRLTAKVVSTVTVEEDSIDWSKLEVTSYGGSPYDISRSYLGEVKYLQRVSTVGGLPPKDKHTANPKAGYIYLSPYSTIYFFYSNSNSL